MSSSSSFERETWINEEERIATLLENWWAGDSERNPVVSIFGVCKSDPVSLDDLRLLVDKDPNLLRVTDEKGLTPLNYLGKDRLISPKILEYLAGIAPDVLSHMFSSSNHAPSTVFLEAFALETVLEAFAEGLSLEVINTVISEWPDLLESPDWIELHPLHETISRGKATDDTLLYLIKRFPDAAERGSWEGRLPLHLACQYRSSLHIVRALMDQYRSALLLPDVDGNLPIHKCFSTEKRRKPVDLDVVRYLVEQNQQILTIANDEQQLALHAACEARAELECIEFLCEKCPESVEQESASGSYPIHCACDQEHYSSVILYLAEKFHDACSHKDECGDLPIHILLRTDWTHSPEEQLNAAKKLLTIFPQAIHSRNNEDDYPIHVAATELSNLSLVKYLIDCWEKTPHEEYALDQALKVYGDRGSLPLHCACMGRQKRLDIIEFILNLNLDAVRECDDDGNLPVHLLLDGRWSNHQANKGREDLIRKMITLFPGSIERKDENDMSPFSLACRSCALPGLIEELRGNFSALHQVVEDGACLAAVMRAFALYPTSIRDRNRQGELPLAHACHVGAPLEVIQFLYKRFRDGICARDKYGNMPLHAACTSPAVRILEFLMSKYKTALRIPNFEGSLPLHLICLYAGSLREVRAIAEGNKDAFKRPDGEGRLPVHVHASSGSCHSSPILLYLINENPATCGVADLQGCLPLHLVAKNLRCYGLAIQNVAKRNKQALTVRNGEGYLPLHCYFLSRVQFDLSHVKCLAQKITSQTSEDGSSFLHTAVKARASIDVIRYLLDRDPLCAPRSKDKLGRLPLHYSKDYDAAYAVYSAYPDGIRVRDDRGNLPLHVACYGGSLDVVRCLYVCDAFAISERNSEGDLPIHLACEARCDYEVIEFLVRQDLSCLDARGRIGQFPLHAWFRGAVCEFTPVRRCLDKDDTPALDYLIAKYPNALLAQDDRGFFPVHHACLCSHDMIFKLLLACPAVIEASG